MLRGLRPRLETRHQVTIADAVLEAAVDLAIRFDRQRRLPGRRDRPRRSGRHAHAHAGEGHADSRDDRVRRDRGDGDPRRGHGAVRGGSGGPQARHCDGRRRRRPRRRPAPADPRARGVPPRAARRPGRRRRARQPQAQARLFRPRARPLTPRRVPAARPQRRRQDAPRRAARGVPARRATPSSSASTSPSTPTNTASPGCSARRPVTPRAATRAGSRRRCARGRIRWCCSKTSRRRTRESSTCCRTCSTRAT